jgi:hypothetical protein
MECAEPRAIRASGRKTRVAVQPVSKRKKMKHNHQQCAIIASITWHDTAGGCGLFIEQYITGGRQPQKKLSSTSLSDDNI